MQIAELLKAYKAQDQKIDKVTFVRRFAELAGKDLIKHAMKMVAGMVAPSAEPEMVELEAEERGAQIDSGGADRGGGARGGAVVAGWTVAAETEPEAEDEELAWWA